MTLILLHIFGTSCRQANLTYDDTWNQKPAENLLHFSWAVIGWSYKIEYKTIAKWVKMFFVLKFGESENPILIWIGLRRISLKYACKSSFFSGRKKANCHYLPRVRIWVSYAMTSQYLPYPATSFTSNGFPHEFGNYTRGTLKRWTFFEKKLYKGQSERSERSPIPTLRMLVTRNVQLQKVVTGARMSYLLY